MLSLLFALFWSPPTPEQNIRLFGNYMLHYVHQILINFVYQMFEQVE